MATDQVMLGSYDHRVVALSTLTSVLGAYAALELAERTHAARGRAARVAWSTHDTAMLAFSLPVPMLYHGPSRPSTAPGQGTVVDARFRLA